MFEQEQSVPQDEVDVVLLESETALCYTDRNELRVAGPATARGMKYGEMARDHSRVAYVSAGRYNVG